MFQKSLLKYHKLLPVLCILFIAGIFHFFGNSLSQPNEFYIPGLSDLAYFFRNLSLLFLGFVFLPRRFSYLSLIFPVLYICYGLYQFQEAMDSSSEESRSAENEMQKREAEWRKNLPSQMAEIYSSLDWAKSPVGDFPDLLRKHLIESPAWHAHQYKNVFVAYLREDRPDGFHTRWNHNLDHGLKMSVIIAKKPFLPGGLGYLDVNSTVHPVQLHYEWEHSSSYRARSHVRFLPHPYIEFSIREHNENLSRPETLRVLSFLEKDLSKIFRGKKSVLPRQEKMALTISQPESNFPSARAAFNPGEPGEAYLRIVRLVGESSLSVDYYKNTSMQLMGGNKSEDVNFLYSATFSWVDVKDAERVRVELWFTPVSGGESRLIDSSLVAVRNPSSGMGL